MSYDDPVLKELGGYLKAEEPGLRERAQAWGMAIGLQKVDGLAPSQFLLEVAKDHIEGKITQNQAHRRIRDYYATKDESKRPDPATEEPDKVSERIVAILGDGGFEFTPEYFVSIHARLFRGVLSTAGKLRTVNIRKHEWVLKNDSVTYGSAATLKQSLARHFLDEREFDYGGKSPRKMIPHFSRFIAQIWQVHPFGEGNTRTTAVFAIKYLRSLGYQVENDMFRDNSWYFRNALVRANYADYAKDVRRDWSYLEAFFRNLLLGEKNELKSRYLLIGLTEDDKAKIHELTEGKRTEGGQKRWSEKDEPKKVVRKGGQKTEDKILALLREYPHLTQAGIVAALCINRSAIQKHLRKLKESGRLRRIGPDKGGRWEVVATA